MAKLRPPTKPPARPADARRDDTCGDLCSTRLCLLSGDELLIEHFKDACVHELRCVEPLHSSSQAS